MHRWFPGTLAVLSVWVLGGCHSPVDAPNSTDPAKCEADQPVLAAQQTDILFVIDNSNSMADNQAEVARELPAFIAALQQGAGIQQDFQVGVITTSVYLNAVIAGNGFYIEYPSQSGHLQPVPTTDERILSVADPDLVTKFSQLVHQGTGGSGQETAFEATRLALTSELITESVSAGGNKELLRPGARLLVVVVGDEDDCSELPPRPPHVRISNNDAIDDCHDQAAALTPVTAYYDIFRSLDDGYNDGSPRELIWATIGPVSTVDKSAQLIEDNNVARNIDCPTSGGAGFRMHDMAQRFDPDLEDLDSICLPSYHDALVDIAAQAALGQSVDVQNAPSGDFLQVQLTRGDGSKTLCTVENNGIRFQPKTDSRPARIYFQNQCLRRSTDTAVTVREICIG